MMGIIKMQISEAVHDNSLLDLGNSSHHTVYLPSFNNYQSKDEESCWWLTGY